METAGSICFGVVIGWITYRTLRRREGNVMLSDIATVLGVIGGAGITTLFGKTEIFGGYCIGLAIGFFSYLVIAMATAKKTPDGSKDPDIWMG